MNGVNYKSPAQQPLSHSFFSNRNSGPPRAGFGSSTLASANITGLSPTPRRIFAHAQNPLPVRKLDNSVNNLRGSGIRTWSPSVSSIAKPSGESFMNGNDSVFERSQNGIVLDGHENDNSPNPQPHGRYQPSPEKQIYHLEHRFEELVNKVNLENKNAVSQIVNQQNELVKEIQKMSGYIRQLSIKVEQLSTQQNVVSHDGVKSFFIYFSLF